MAARSDENQRGVYKQLEQNLIGPAPDEVLPITPATPMMEVVAPTNMAEGFEFEVQVNGGTYAVKVPKGGVQEGEKFAVPYPSGSQAIHPMQTPKVNIPVGAWRDGICNCCAHGPFHAHFCTTLWCPLIAVGQVVSRLKLTHWGKQGSREETAGAFLKIFYGFLLFVIFYSIVWSLPASDDYYDDGSNATSMDILLDGLRRFIAFLYFVTTVYIAYNVRSHIRSKYAIPDRLALPNGGEDIVCSVCCLHLTIMQMLRHTTDYDTYRADGCSPSGMPPHIPDAV